MRNEVTFGRGSAGTSSHGGRPHGRPRGIRDRGALESAVAQPTAGFGDVELHPDPLAKAAALGYSLVRNHPFFDGDKRVGHAALETTLMLNGWEIAASIDEQEQVFLGVADGTMARQTFLEWVRRRAATRLS